jgi:hypothetical protein
MLCSVVVGASGLEAGEEALASLRAAVGPAVSATRAPSEMRLARVLAGTKRSSEARRRARERPRESSHGSLSERSRSRMPASPRCSESNADRAVEADPRRLSRVRCRRSCERRSDAFQGSRAARSRGYPDMRRPVLSTLQGAYGVSCRARACALRHKCGDSPPQSLDCNWVPRSPPPWGRKTRHEVVSS